METNTYDFCYPIMLCIQYVGKAASTIRAAMKEPAKAKASAQEVYAFKLAKWDSGIQGPKVEVGRAVPP
jgi:Mitochondrial ATP synthase epsilon chain